MPAERQECTDWEQHWYAFLEEARTCARRSSFENEDTERKDMRNGYILRPSVRDAWSFDFLSLLLSSAAAHFSLGVLF